MRKKFKLSKKLESKIEEYLKLKEEWDYCMHNIKEFSNSHLRKIDNKIYNLKFDILNIIFK